MADVLQLAIVAVVIAAFVVCGCLATRAKKTHPLFRREGNMTVPALRLAKAVTSGRSSGLTEQEVQEIANKMAPSGLRTR